MTSNDDEAYVDVLNERTSLAWKKATGVALTTSEEARLEELTRVIVEHNKRNRLGIDFSPEVEAALKMIESL